VAAVFRDIAIEDVRAEYQLGSPRPRSAGLAGWTALLLAAAS
jgi:hypothetical protein